MSTHLLLQNSSSGDNDEMEVDDGILSGGIAEEILETLLINRVVRKFLAQDKEGNAALDT